MSDDNRLKNSRVLSVHSSGLVVNAAAQRVAADPVLVNAPLPATARIEFGLRVPPSPDPHGPRYPRSLIESVLRGTFGPRTKILRIKGPTPYMREFCEKYLGMKVRRKDGEWLAGNDKLVRLVIEIARGDAPGPELRMPSTTVPVSAVRGRTVPRPGATGRGADDRNNEETAT